jgi:hypothetical protein
MKFLPVALCLCLAGPVWAAPSAVTITTRGSKIGHVPHMVRMSAHVLLDEHNRRICFEWEAPKAYGRGCEDINGLAGKLTYWRDIKFERSGMYSIRATLERDDNKTRVSNIEQVRIIGFGEEIEDGSDTTNP